MKLNFGFATSIHVAFACVWAPQSWNPDGDADANQSFLQEGGDMSDNHTGACLCGAVRFRTRGALRGVIYCHCSQCRKQSGHFYAATNVADADIVIEGTESITWYEASAFARRGFCKTCGSVLFWKPREDAYVSVLAGSFDEPTDLRGQCHIFVGDKGDYYSIDDTLPQFEKSTPSIKVADE
jgi:hypothetical protein